MHTINLKYICKIQVKLTATIIKLAFTERFECKQLTLKKGKQQTFNKLKKLLIDFALAGFVFFFLFIND